MAQMERDVSEIGKLTMATIGAGSIAKRVAAEKTELVCCRIFGIASGIKMRKNIAGDLFEAIAGNFEAVNMETGEVFGSGILFLPGGLHEKILEPLKNSDEDITIQFGLEISAFPASNPQGYSWKAKQIVKPETADPLAALRSSALQDMKLIPAPAEGAKPKRLAAPKKKGKAA